MPKTNLCRPMPEILSEHFKGWLKSSGKQKDIAEQLKMSPQKFNYKLQTGKFTVLELIKIFHIKELDEKELARLLLY